MDQLKAVPQIAKALPPQLKLTNPVTASIKVDGTTQAIAFNLVTDLTGNQVVYTGVLDKAAGVPLKLAAAGTRKDAEGRPQVEVQNATLVLGDLNLKAGQIQLGQNLERAGRQQSLRPRLDGQDAGRAQQVQRLGQGRDSRHWSKWCRSSPRSMAS